MNNHQALTIGRTAVITGGASGVGLACAKRFAGLGMNVCLADVNESALTSAVTEVREARAEHDIEVVAIPTDVSQLHEVERLRDAALRKFDDVAVLMNNAGIGAGGGAWQNYEGWQKVMNVNLWGVINGVHAFTPAMVEQARPGAIVNTGSKQGITNPPGNVAYNVTKSGIKTLTEGLAHELRNTEGCNVSAHLLVPGFTYTGLIRRHIPEKPPAAWWPDQVADYLISALARGDFYVICPDNDVSTEVDNKRIRWNADDMINNRPALSRWHPDFASAFEGFSIGD